MSLEKSFSGGHTMVIIRYALQWRNNGRSGFSNHQPHDCLYRCRSKKTSKLRVTGICEGNSPVTGEFPAQKASNAENFSIWWRHHGLMRHINAFKLPCSHFQQIVDLTNWGLNEMVAMSQTAFWSSSIWKKPLVFWFIFHWSLFLYVHLSIRQYWLL